MYHCDLQDWWVLHHQSPVARQSLSVQMRASLEAKATMICDGVFKSTRVRASDVLRSMLAGDVVVDAQSPLSPAAVSETNEDQDEIQATVAMSFVRLDVPLARSSCSCVGAKTYTGSGDPPSAALDHFFFF